MGSKKGLHPKDVASECKGGFIFPCCDLSESFLGRPNVDSSPLFENSWVPLADIFRDGKYIGHGISILNAH